MKSKRQLLLVVEMTIALIVLTGCNAVEHKSESKPARQAKALVVIPPAPSPPMSWAIEYPPEIDPTRYTWSVEASEDLVTWTRLLSLVDSNGMLGFIEQRKERAFYRARGDLISP